MPAAVKEIYMAKNLTELKKKNAVDLLKIKDKSNNMLAESANKLFNAAKTKLDEVETDEEVAYVFLYRAMEIWQIIMKSEEYISNKKYYQLMYGKEVNDIIKLLEKYTNKLQDRYAALTNSMVSPSKESPVDQFKLATIVEPKKKSAGKGSVISNGIKKSMLIDNHKCIDDYNLVLNKDFNISESQPEIKVEEKSISCAALRERVIGSGNDVLVIDTRPEEDYALSKIISVHCVNIPGSSITLGLSANKLGTLIESEREKSYWGQRDQYKQLVLLDWSSREKDVKPGTPLDNLHIILTKWDPDCFYKNNPLFLSGGFEEFLDTYPTLTTNPNIKPPEKPLSGSFVHLSEHTIEYPMNVLEEEKSVPKTVSKVTVGADSVTLGSRPSVDRSSKPPQLLEQLDKADHTLMSLRPGEINASVASKQPSEKTASVASKQLSEKTVSIASSKPQTFNFDETMEEEKVAPPRPTQISQLPSETSRGRVTDKGNSYISSTIIQPPTPRTPPRSEKPTVLSKKVNTVSGDGDGEIRLEKTKFETPTRGGLKRSASSPNINKLGEEVLDKSSCTPLFDRNTKPKPSMDYMPRSAGTDNVYMAGSNEKGRGLTGLKNLGNLCYMNSIMQCISHTEELKKELTRFNPKESRNGRQIAGEVSSLLRSLWQSDTRITSCRNLKLRVGALRHSFSTTEQQDSHEFLTLLVDWLHEDLNEPSSQRSLEGADVATGEKAWGEFRQKNHSVVLDLFYGQLKSTVTCDHCRTESVLFEPFSNLSVPLPSSEDDKDRTFTLQECLKLYLKGESISGWVCPNCKTARNATKKLDITRLPPVLIVHLKRFMNPVVGVGWCRKRMNMVDFPLSDLNMKPFTHPESELRCHDYNLYAVSNHYGSMESGHYTAYCKNHVVNKWYKFDDQDINEISPGEVKSSAAYILFYESSQLNTQSLRIVD